jgi:hypothetical protein
MYKKLLVRILGIFDIPGDIIVGIWSLAILAGCMYSIITTKQVSMPIATIFCTIITNFGAHRVAKIWKGIPNKPAEKNLDCQGEGK